MFPQISIVTVVRNASEAIKKTIESVNNQTYSNIDYVVVDGASTDETINVIEQNNDKISKWISESDNGLYFAMNKGLALANGDFVLFMNAGDVFSNNLVIEKIAKNMQEPNAIYFGYVQICSGDVSWETKAINNNQYLQKGDKFLPHHQSIFYPKEYYKSECYDTQFKIVGDVDFTLRACSKYPKYFINVNTIKSELEGFGIMRYSNFKHTLEYSNETFILYKKHSNYFSELSRLLIFPKYLAKFIAYHIGGLKLINRLIKYNYKSSRLIDYLLCRYYCYPNSNNHSHTIIKKNIKIPM
jgi:putative colanic acid biosynthesis glycosyltransferase